MNGRLVSAGGLLAGILGVAVLGAVRGPGAVDGQVVLVPALRIEEVATGPVVRVDGCSATGEGLRVAGQVTAVPGGQVVVAVTGGDPASAGRASGAGFLAAAAGRADEVGAFVLDVPWAQRDARFAVLASPEGPQRGVTLTGPTATCPPVASLPP